MSTRIESTLASQAAKAGRPPDAVLVAGAPDVPGRRFRRFAGPADYPGMVAVTHAAYEADGVDERPTVEQYAAEWDHST
jgi:hypothetical protein